MQPTENQAAVSNNLDIAIIGMAGRFPGANTINEFWDNLKYGVESIRFYPEEEVIESGVSPDMARDPDFVPAAGGIDHEYDFDAEFFEFNPRDAEITDPQQRLALETAWEALEAAGYNPDTYPGRIGVFAGVSMNTYLLVNLAANHQLMESVGHFQIMTANDKDFLATRLSYKLNLKGPSMSVQTACSTGLVAVNLACQSLLNYQSDMVLAGGVSITPKGRLYKEGFIFSKDGRCRAFDEAAQGTVAGNGIGLVILKRLEDAITDGDHIHAVIRGSAVNNDGSLKVGYTAPSVSGQADVILEAQAMSGVDPDTITYVEAHGTGTLLGDPIEIAALTQAFRTATERKNYCAIGSVKTNIGHLDAAAGISGFMKAVLAVEHGQIPPSLHFKKANPKLGIEDSPFFVNTQLCDWQTEGIPRRAAISSFGFGGTNVHTIIEEAPARATCSTSRTAEVLLVSGRNEASLEANLKRLGHYLEQHSDANLADIAYTLQVGRKSFKYRACLVAHNAGDAAKALLTMDARNVLQGVPRDAAPKVAFMFSGQGSQYAGMAEELYSSEPAFRAALDEIADLMRPELDVDLRSIIFPKTDREAAERLLAQTRYTQPAMFAVEYALAKLWQSWGIHASGMIGHSIGEYVAATIAGVFTLADAACLICLRGRLVQGQPEGAMLSVPLPEAEVQPLLNEHLSLAAVNAPRLCVVAGETAAVDALQRQLSDRNIETTRLVVSHAFHSHMLAHAAGEFEAAVAKVALQTPAHRFVSNVTGDWITPEQATSPHYWADHLRQTVRFSAGLTTLLSTKPAVLLEIGPGQVLTTLARQHREQLQGVALVNSTRHPLKDDADVPYLLGAVGQLWLHGLALDWKAFHHHGLRRRVPLPTYAFQRKRYWVPPMYMRAPQVPGAMPYPGAKTDQASIQAEAKPAGLPKAQDSIEHTVTQIWERMLGINGIGAHDDFFKLGGHSLMATQLIAEVRRATNTGVSVAALFKTPTIAGLSEEIRQLRAADPNFKVTTIPVISREGRLPLTFHQEMVWDFERKWPGTARFNGFISIKLSGPLDREAMQFAADEMLRRHEVLRTVYRHENGVNFAVIQPFKQISLPLYDYSAMPPAMRENRLLELSNALVREPFDLTKDVYIRPVLVKLEEHLHMFVLASHYIAVDGWTIGLVIQEFSQHYAAYKKLGPRMPDLAFQCVDYAAWQRKQITDEAIDIHMPYWRKQFADLTPQFPVPVDRMRGIRPSLKGGTYHFSLSSELTEAIKSFSHEHGYTTFMTFVAVLNALYHAYSGLDDIVIGTMTGDREIGTESMMGSLVNLLALRTRLNDGHTFLDVLENVRKTVVDAFAHRIPFERLAERLNRNLLRQPLFRTVFVLRNVPYTETRVGELHVELASVPIDRAVADMDLTLYIQEKQGVFHGYFEYNTDLFARSTIEEVAGYFVSLLRDTLTRPDQPLATMLPQPARRPIKTNPVQRLLSALGILEAA